MDTSDDGDGKDGIQEMEEVSLRPTVLLLWWSHRRDSDNDDSGDILLPVL